MLPSELRAALASETFAATGDPASKRAGQQQPNSPCAVTAAAATGRHQSRLGWLAGSPACPLAFFLYCTYTERSSVCVRARKSLEVGNAAAKPGRASSVQRRRC